MCTVEKKVVCLPLNITILLPVYDERLYESGSVSTLQKWSELKRRLPTLPPMTHTRKINFGAVTEDVYGCVEDLCPTNA